jgi:hypothetical protein
MVKYFCCCNVELNKVDTVSFAGSSVRTRAKTGLSWLLSSFAQDQLHNKKLVYRVIQKSAHYFESI